MTLEKKKEFLKKKKILKKIPKIFNIVTLTSFQSLRTNPIKLFCPFLSSCGQYYKLFTAVITPLAAYFSMILTELCR
jgi:hypothetical protein